MSLALSPFSGSSALMRLGLFLPPLAPMPKGGLVSPGTVGAVRAVALARAGHVLCLLCFAALGAFLHLSLPYYIGVGIAAATLFYQHSIVDIRDFRWLTQRYFMRNGIVAVAMALCTAISYHW